MLKWGRQGLVVGWLGLLAVQGVSAAEDRPGASDLESVMRYPNSWIVDYSQAPVPEYRLATGSMKKINGVISPELSQYISGQLTRITYQLPSGHNSTDAFNHFKRQFDNLGPEVLFRCKGRRCGNSNQWANVQFGISRLYGVDREQFYLALKLPAIGSEPARYLAFYTVMRGNKRVYAQLDLIQSSAAASGTAGFIAKLEQGLRVFRQPGQLSQAEVEPLRQHMTDQPALRLILVGHSDQGATPELYRATSLALAETLRQQLLAQGLDGSRLTAYGVGFLAPAYAASVPNQRVELLLR
ncbi:MAG: DUF4892 domain-containing protein [Motiliproteus sp.]